MTLDPRVYVASNMVKACDLFVKEKETLDIILGLIEGEILEEVYSYGGFYPILKIRNNIIVGITNLRIFKLEKGIVSVLRYRDVVSVKHERNGLFRWDKVVCQLCGEGGEFDTFGVYHGDACARICNHMLKRIRIRTN